MEWTDEEVRELIALWPTHSSAQLGRRLHRPATAIRAKANRLREQGLLAFAVIKHFELPPAQARPKRSVRNDSAPAEKNLNQFNQTKSPTAENAALSGGAPCPLLELDATRCHWPLGEVQQVAALFCGGDVVPGRIYCPHHLGMATGRG